MIAHFARLSSGKGQHVDVSVQQSVAQVTLSAVLSSAVGHENFVPRPTPPGNDAEKATLDLSGSGARTRKSKWKVKDGLAEMHLAMGPLVGKSTNALFAWMKAEGWPDSRFSDWDWPGLHVRVEAGEITEADLDAARESVAQFMLTRSKGELMSVAIERDVRVAPVQTTADILEDRHEAARGFLQTIKGPFGDYVLPGDFALGGRMAPLTPAPRLGEHNREVFTDWLGLSETDPAEKGSGA